MAAEGEAVDHHHHATNTSTMPPAPSMSHYFYGSGGGASSSSFNLSFADDFSIPAVPVKGEEAAEMEWLSNFVDDSYTYPGSYCYPPEAMAAAQQQPSNKQNGPAGGGDDYTNTGEEAGGVRRCTHCASEKTPQWRTGPLGPKTLCNACGVRYKSGRLVPEYRPAASPTFVLTQHSNSHRKVMELRRQKELIHLRGSVSSSSSPFRDYGL